MRRLQHPDIERGWQRQAARLQKDLAEVAARRQLRWSFQVVRGRMTTQVVEEAMATDLVAVTSVTRTTVETLQALECPVLILPARPASGVAVGVLVDDSPAAEQALRFAATLLPAGDKESLRIFAVAAPGMLEAVEKRVERILAGAGVHVRLIQITAPDVAVLTQSVRTHGVRTLVLAAGSAAPSKWLRPLLERPPCAAWLVR